MAMQKDSGDAAGVTGAGNSAGAAAECSEAAPVSGEAALEGGSAGVAASEHAEREQSADGAGALEAALRRLSNAAGYEEPLVQEWLARAAALEADNARLRKEISRLRGRKAAQDGGGAMNSRLRDALRE